MMLRHTTRRSAWSAGLLGLLLLVGASTAAEQAAVRPLWRPDQFEGVTEVESRLFDYANAERRKQNLPDLLPMPELRVAARQHCLEMLQEDYFSHTSPHADWPTPNDRAWFAGFWEACAAENIVMMKTRGFTVSNPEVAAEFMYGQHGWMNSPGHRANILNRDYTHTAVGVVIRGGNYYAAQLFARPWYQFSEVRLEQVGNDYELCGRARLIGLTDTVHIGLDQDIVESLAVTPDGTFDFRVRIPRDGGQHRIGLHPAKDRQTYWVKQLFFVDTAKPLAEALVRRF